IEVLRRYPWPGNIRELKNVVERAVIMATGDVVRVSDLSERISGTRASTIAPRPSATTDDELDFKERVKRYEIRLITEALERAKGNQSEAARALRMPLRTFTYKLRTLGIHV